ncbi:zinc-ribbon domain-containing protein [Rathayibacter sp. YIM 133350]|uniref:zinc ribbon domain-containing protein n=1 Tax=Rathayibacter sp. YIM 133350 TaxID=3131992 RepID=UPI00307E1780
MTATLITCPECGTKNPAGDDFCGNCGSYLAWEEVEAPDAPDATDAPDGPDPTGAPLDAGQAPVAQAPLATASASVEHSAPKEHAPQVDDVTTHIADFFVPPSAEPETIELTEPPSDTEFEPFAADAVPIQALRPQPEQAQQPPAQRPQPSVAEEPAARRPVATAPRTFEVHVRPEDAPKPGDVVCPRCGAGNPPGRNFCRRCAMQLTATANRTLAPSSQPVAGARPLAKRSRMRPAFIVVPVLILVLAAAAWLGRDAIASLTASLIDRVAAATPVSPNQLTASSSMDGRGAELAYDGFSNTSWAPAAAGPAAGEFIEATFAKPFRLVSLQMIAGASDKPADFLADGRPDTVLVTLTRASGGTVEKTITVADEPGSQSWDMGVDDVKAVRLTLATAHGATDATHVGIAELAFRGR